ncbi:uncharacterized protein MONOS_15532 [Monocercomonoides exilis]|uniref:uncharacterized protein n=1 Tax=Monocercomonoides exilis TaxID=2049356 RepID=UPI003559D0A6|nr:hypothetical protein MONOS_15532 [Monocercomonoides exilis]|eukprot:MONOS_15532.1-p1 / transcript=MONOS_15532.1 / gene=MONOS_15532 / organism=Monocercomonoides_exilis_PA203 / gene_product=unspecified product / transcript_product=unspecified product / location=Mono_scaffold01264:7859-8410(-) / protein_length=184 / sequence_SO=supercontig / SO=protein_coding / is_pseudo=false
MAASQKYRNQLEESMCACDTSSVILSSSSSSSSTSSSSSRSSKTVFRDPKDESKMTAKGKKCSKDDMVLFQEDEDYFFWLKKTTTNKALTSSISQSQASASSSPRISSFISPQSARKPTKAPRSSLLATLEGMKRRKEEKKNTDFLSLYSSLISERMQTLIIVCHIALLDDKLFEEEVKDGIA